MSNLIDTLRAARELLSDEAKWTKLAAARDTFGSACNYNEDTACRWCLGGAILRVGGLESRTVDALELVRGLLDTGTDDSDAIQSFNDADGTTHADVLRVLDLAIERAAQGPTSTRP